MDRVDQVLEMLCDFTWIEDPQSSEFRVQSSEFKVQHSRGRSVAVSLDRDFEGRQAETAADRVAERHGTGQRVPPTALGVCEPKA